MTRLTLSLAAAALLLATAPVEASPAASQMDKLNKMWGESRKGMPSYSLDSVEALVDAMTGTPVRSARPAADAPASGKATETKPAN
ncbi:MAG: hypothetical protein AAFU49_22865 [Pseudomonadota bacterium]